MTGKDEEKTPDVKDEDKKPDTGEKNPDVSSTDLISINFTFLGIV